MSKYATLGMDSAGEIARLLFSWEMKKKSSDMETVRGPQNFPGMTERLNILTRQLRNLRDNGMNVVILGHEDIQGIYAPGKSMIATKGQPQADPIAVRGWIDIPGRTAPQELERVIDQLFHMKLFNGKLAWMARRELLTVDSYWDVKDRFGASEIANGILPASYEEVRKLFKDKPNWSDYFIWAIYGPPGIGKTRAMAATFPRPMKILDVDKGTGSIRDLLKRFGGSVKTLIPDSKGDKGQWKTLETFPSVEPGGEIDVVQFDSEDCSSYQPFLQEIAGCL